MSSNMVFGEFAIPGELVETAYAFFESLGDGIDIFSVEQTWDVETDEMSVGDVVWVFSCRIDAELAIVIKLGNTIYSGCLTTSVIAVGTKY